MIPPEPANDERPPLWPGMSKRAEERFGFWFSVIGLIALIGFAIAVLDNRHWIGVAITVGVGFVVMLIAAIWRRIVYGRA